MSDALTDLARELSVRWLVVISVIDLFLVDLGGDGPALSTDGINLALHVKGIEVVVGRI
jgi:hypothetical protein